MRRGIKIAVMALLVVVVASLSMIGCAGEAEEKPAGGEVVTPEVFKVKYSTECSELSFTFASYYYPFQEEVERLSDGRLEIIWYPSETLHKWAEFPEALKGGLVDIACCTPGRRLDVFPLYLLVSFPGLHRHEYELALIFFEHLREKYDAPYWDAIDAVNISHNFLETERWFMSMKKPLRGLADLKGFMYQTTAQYLWEANAFGMVPVSGMYVDIYEMLQKGMLDGSSHWLCDVTARMKWHTLATPGKGYVGISPFTASADVPMAVNKPYWQSLPKDLQKIIQTAADTWLTSANMQGNRIMSNYAKKAFIDMGFVYVEWPEEDMKAYDELQRTEGQEYIWKEVAKFGAEDELREMVAEYQKYQAESQFDESLFKTSKGTEYEVRDLTKGWEGAQNVLVDYPWFVASEFMD